MATATTATSTRTTTSVTITHTCGHKRRVTLHSVGAARKSAELFDLAAQDCPQCAADAMEQAAKQKADADAVYAEYEREQERIAARRYRVTLHYDAHPPLEPRVVWEGQGFWVASQWAQDAAKSLIVGDSYSYVEHTADGATFSAYRQDHSKLGLVYLLEGHATIEEQPAEQPPATQVTQAARQLTWLKREASDVEENLASLTHTAVQIGEASDWRDARLPQIDETIHYWKGRYLALTRQISAESANVAVLVAARA